MTWLRVLALRLAALLRKGRLEEALDEELCSHLEMLNEQNVRKGMAPAEARYAALRSFGGFEQAKEIYRERRGLPMIETLFQDLRYGVRLLAKNPSFTLLAVLTLALGIGVNTAIFSTVNGVLLRPFPFREPDRLVTMWCTEVSRGVPQMGCAEPDLQEIAGRNHSFESLAGYFWQNANLTDGQPERVDGSCVSPGLFRLLGVNAALGRTFSEDESLFGKHRVAVLSYKLWE